MTQSDKDLLREAREWIRGESVGNREWHDILARLDARLAAGEREEPPQVFAEKFNRLTNYLGTAHCGGYKCRLPHCSSCNDEEEASVAEQQMWDLCGELTRMLKEPAPAVVPSEVVEELERRLAVEDSLETGMDVHDVYSIAADAIAALKGGAKP